MAKKKTRSSKPTSRGKSPAPVRSVEAQRLWDWATAEFELEPSHLALLQSACDMIDRREQARQSIAAHGQTTFRNRYGEVRAHPDLQTERQCAVTLARILRELRLEESAPETRLPRQEKP
jgi:phage terminase small subunit